MHERAHMSSNVKHDILSHVMHVHMHHRNRMYIYTYIYIYNANLFLGHWRAMCGYTPYVARRAYARVALDVCWGLPVLPGVLLTGLRADCLT